MAQPWSSLGVLLTQIIGYVLALAMSLVVCVPMALHQDEFRGHCLLFSTGEWQERDGQFKVQWASQVRELEIYAIKSTFDDWKETKNSE